MYDVIQKSPYNGQSETKADYACQACERGLVSCIFQLLAIAAFDWLSSFFYASCDLPKV